MDRFTLDKLEFDRVRQILGRFCRCSLGERLARRIVPSRNAESVRRWLAQTQEMIGALVAVGTPPFGGIVDIAAELGRAQPGGGVSGEDFAAISATLTGASAVRAWLLGLGEDRPELLRLADAIGDFSDEVAAIEAVVDAHGEVRDSASPRLGEIRREIDAAHRRIREVVYGFVRRPEVAAYLQSTTVQIHEDRYVLPLKVEHRGRVPGIVHRSSHTGATIFVEPAECVELNNLLIDLGDRERDEITRLLSRLAIRVHRRADEIAATLKALAQVDLIAAKAQYAYEFEMHAPEIVDQPRLILNEARHPLLVEQAWQQSRGDSAGGEPHPVVPIDVRLGDDFDLLIVTGSNTGGKTVALKTVGLLAVMAQSGLHIPARKDAVLPVFRHILLDVGDEQSLEQSLSTFGAHLSRIRQILAQADRHSLVLLDELGSGTDPDEGSAIGQAVLDELGRIGCLGMVSTHLGVLKAYAYNHERADNASVEFDVQTLRPTYKLLIGQPGESHAITIAARAGLPKRVVQNARRHLPRQGQQLRQAIRATTATRAASEQALSDARTAQLAADQRQQDYQQQLKSLQALNEQFNEWISSLPAMKPGDQVFVRRLNKPGTLRRLQLSRQIAVIDVDQMQVEVPLQELMPSFGDPQMRDEIVSLRQQIARQARQAELLRAQAETLRDQQEQALSAARNEQARARRWLDQLQKLKVGDLVTFASPPHEGSVESIDLTGGKISVKTPQGSKDVPFGELFADVPGLKKKGRRRQTPPPEAPDRPIFRRSRLNPKARANRPVLLGLPAGSTVFVTTFGRKATLLRIDAEKEQAVVQSGAFEMQVPLADVEPLADAAGHRPT